MASTRTRHSSLSFRDQSPAARLRRAGQGSGHRAAAPRVSKSSPCDRYANAPAMQVAHRSPCHHHARWRRAARSVALEEKPHFIVPEIEAIATDTLVELEKRRLHRHPHRTRGEAHDEPRGHPPARGRGARSAMRRRTASPTRRRNTARRLQRSACPAW